MRTDEKVAPARGPLGAACGAEMETPFPTVWNDATISLSRRPPGSQPEPCHAVAVGSTLGRCQLTGILGRGASATVYRALHRGLRIPVAVKVPNSEAGGFHPDCLEELRCEAELLAACTHPNIVRVYDLDDNPELPYLVLECIDGPNLKEVLRQERSLPAERALDLVLPVLDALEAIWSAGIIHRDVKPGNILLGNDGTVKLADFGQAVRLIDGKPDPARSTVVTGTPAYLAPEQFLTPGDIDHRADIYALGTTLYEMVTGRLPFPGRSRLDVLLKHVMEAPQPPDVRAPGLDAALSDVILVMMAKDAADRYADADVLRAALTGQWPTQAPVRPLWRRLLAFGHCAL